METPGPVAGGGANWRREAAVAFAVLALAAVVFTWPLARLLGDAIPVGGGAPTVALFGLHSMAWTDRALATDGSYWDAPIFHPHQGTFAWSETQPFTALLVGVLSRAVGLVAAYDLVLWLYLAAFGLAGYALARQLVDDRVAALWAGLWLTAGTFSIQQLGVLHLLAGTFPIVCLAAILALAGGVRRGLVWGVGAAFLLTFLTCAQYGLFLTLLVPWAAVALWRGAGRGKRLVAVALPVVAALVLVLPWLLAQRSRLQTMGFERELVNVRGAYLPVDLVTPASGHWLTGRILGVSDAPDAYPWDLGVVVLVCVASAAAAGAFRRRHLAGVARRRAGALTLVAGVALLLGFGPHLALGDGAIVPYAWLHDLVPGLAGVRTPARFGMFAIAGLAALGAVALAFWRRRMTSTGARRTLTAAAFALLAAEMWAVPVALTDPRSGVDDHRAVLDWLAEHEPAEPLVDLPMSASDGEADLEREVRAMWRALVHRHPIVNGYSGYFPEPFRQLRWALAEDPGRRGRRYLRTLGVGYALLHEHDLAPDEGARRRRLLGGEVAWSDGRDTVLRWVAAAERPQPPPSVTARFNTRPRSGDILSLAVSPRPDRARLVAAPAGHRLDVLWTDEVGVAHRTAVRLGGSVLLDAGQALLYVLLQGFSDDGGRAVLVSEERLRKSRP